MTTLFRILLTILLSSNIVLSYGQNKTSDSLPVGFEYIHQVIPDVQYDMRYAGANNFTGRPVPGYKAEVAILTHKAVTQLKAVAKDLQKKGYTLLIYDAYRPQKAVDSFVKWSRDPTDTLMKSAYYPEIPKNELFQRGYIAQRSGHTRGSTIDLTIINTDSQQPLDMGSPHDFFGEISHHTTSSISPAQKANREILRVAMVQHGFKSYSKEWWHYSLRNEPYPDTYFNFEVK